MADMGTPAAPVTLDSARRSAKQAMLRDQGHNRSALQKRIEVPPAIGAGEAPSATASPAPKQIELQLDGPFGGTNPRTGIAPARASDQSTGPTAGVMVGIAAAVVGGLALAAVGYGVWKKFGGRSNPGGAGGAIVA